MTDDDDGFEDLRDLDPDSLPSIEAWVRRQRTIGYHRPPEEPAPKPKKQTTDTDASATSKVWASYIDGCIDRALNRFWDNIEEEVVKHFATRGDLDNLRKEVHREIQRASNKLIIFDASDARAKKSLDDDPQKVVRWDDVRKRG